MRTTFINQLITEAHRDERIFLLVGDLGFSVVEPFAEAFPNRFLNVGVAEQNMAGIAAGLALEGFCVFIYSIGNFPTMRCMEQIRYDICYHNLNVTVVAVGGGYAYGPLGTSHHATEELGMLRTIPNLVVTAPGDPFETAAITSFSIAHSGPCYIRIGKAGEPKVHSAPISALQAGDILTARESGGSKALFSTGAMLKYGCDFADNYLPDLSVYSFPFVKPINKVQLLRIVSDKKRIVTIEEHQAQAGFGSAILEMLHDLLEEGLLASIPSIKRIAIPDRFSSRAGTQSYLRTEANLVLHPKDFDE